MSLLTDFMDTVYPNYCLGCNAMLESSDSVLCMDCIEELPFTHFFEKEDNPVKEIFYGRILVAHAGSALFFTKDSPVQRLLFALKYQNDKHAGLFLGALLAQSLAETDWIKEVDWIVPLPLHRKRERKRGYNQSTVICSKLSEILGIPMNNDMVERAVYTETQTHKTREARWQSMQTVFKVKNEDALRGKHVLLVDDVLTTGATMEVCGSEILKIKDTKLSIATAAYAL